MNYKIYKQYETGKRKFRHGQHYYIGRKPKNYSFEITAKKVGIHLDYGKGDLQIKTSSNQWESLGPAQKKFQEISDKTGVEITFADLLINPNGVTKIIQKEYPEAKGWKIIEKEIPVIELKEKNYSAITAWPYGKGQQRLKPTKREMLLESTGIPIDTRILSKSHKSPLKEEEVKEIIESFKPEELGKGPREILITERGRPMSSYADTYGEAFKHGGIKLYSKPYKQLKKGEPYFMVGREKVPETEMKEKYKFDVIPHEVAHLRLGHTTTKPNDEIAADRWAVEWRERRGIEDKPYYRKGGPRRRLFL